MKYNNLVLANSQWNQHFCKKDLKFWILMFLSLSYIRPKISFCPIRQTTVTPYNQQRKFSYPARSGFFFPFPCRICSSLAADGTNPSSHPSRTSRPIHQSAENFSLMWIKSRAKNECILAILQNLKNQTFKCDLIATRRTIITWDAKKWNICANGKCNWLDSGAFDSIERFG